MSDVDQINALAQLIRCIDGNHTMGRGALAEAILEHRAEWDTPRIIRDPDALDSIDPDTVVIDRRGDIRLVRHAWRFPAVIIRDGEQVRAARNALDEETA